MKGETTYWILGAVHLGLETGHRLTKANIDKGYWMIKKQELADKVKKLEDQVSQLEAVRNGLVRKNQKLEQNIKSLEQLVPKEKLKELDDGTIYRLCDPSLMVFHENRDMGIDIYCEENQLFKRRLLTRIPISVGYDIHEDMSLTQKAEILAPLVSALETAFQDHTDYCINVVASFNKTVYTY